jgi:general secretion pathway protein N
MILPARMRAAVALGWRFAALAAAAAVVALLLTIPSEQFGAAEPVSEPTNVRRTNEPAAEAPAARLMDYPAIAEHPLFYPTRKPWAPPPPPPPEPPPPVVAAAPSPLTDYFLVGVVLSDSMRSALVRAQANKILTLSEGQEIEGWTLKEITPERLFFTAGAATYEMTGRKPSEIR